MKNEQMYIHYGSDAFDKAQFISPRNCWWKPKPLEGTGLWASRLNDQRGWKQWCERNNFPLPKEAFAFRLSEDANLLTLNTEKDLFELPHIQPEEILRREALTKGIPLPEEILNLIPKAWCFLDYERMLQDGIDAIEVVGWPALEEILTTWDCNCIYVMNPKVIEAQEK